MPTKTITTKHVADAVIDLYLSDGRFHTVQSIADHLGCAPSTVRDRLVDPSGFVRDERIDSHEERRSIGPAYVLGPERFRTVCVYGPTMACLRGMIAELRA